MKEEIELDYITMEHNIDKCKYKYKPYLINKFTKNQLLYQEKIESYVIFHK